MRPHEICLGDVLRAFDRAELSSDSQDRILRLFGFSWRQDTAGVSGSPHRPEPEIPETPAQEQRREPQNEAAPPSDDEANEAWVDAMFRPASLNTPNWYRRAEPLEPDTEPDELPLQPVEPLLPPDGQRTLLISMLSSVSRGHEIDVPRLVQRVANLEVLSKLPLRSRRSMTGDVQVILDTSKRMEPFAQDQSQLVATLTRLLPDERLRVVRCQGVPPDEPGRKRRPSRSYSYPSQGALVLLLSDLGQGGGPFAPPMMEPERWIGFSRRLAAHGCAFLVLAPAAADLIDPRLARSLDIIPWDRRSSAAAVQARRRRPGG